MTRPHVAVLLLLFVSVPLPAQDAPLHIRFLKREKGQVPVPEVQHFRVELHNPHAETRWLVTPFGVGASLPETGKFTADPEQGFPFMAMRAGKDGAQAVMVGFLGEPRFAAFRLSAGAKIVFEDFTVPGNADLSEAIWAWAKAIRVEGETPLEKWLGVPLDCAREAVLAGPLMWNDILYDDAGELLKPVARGKVTRLEVDLLNRGKSIVGNYQVAGRYYAPADRAKDNDLPRPWTNLATFRPSRPLRVDHLAFAPNNSWLAASLAGFKVVGLDLKSGREIVFPKSDERLAHFFAFTPEGRLLVKQAERKGEPETQLTIHDWTSEKEFDVLRQSSRATLGRRDHIASPTGDRVAVAQKKGFAIWEFAKFDTIARLAWPVKAEDYTFRAGVFSPDGKRFAAGVEHPTKGGRALVWDIKTGALLADIPNKQTGITHLAFSADGGLLAFTGNQASSIGLHVVDGVAEHPAIRLRSFNHIHALALSPDGKTLAVSVAAFGIHDGPQHGVELFDVESRQRIGAFSGLNANVPTLAFSANGRRLAAGDAEGLVKVWERP